MDPIMTSLSFSDAELGALNDIIRQHKVTVTNEDLVLLLMGKRTTPLVDLTVKIGTAYEKRAGELQKEQEATKATAPAADAPAQN